MKVADNLEQLDELSINEIESIAKTLSREYNEEFYIEYINLPESDLFIQEMSNIIESYFIDRTKIKVFNKKYISIEVQSSISNKSINLLIDLIESLNIQNHVVHISHEFCDIDLASSCPNQVNLALTNQSGEFKDYVKIEFPFLTQLSLTNLSNDIFYSLSQSARSLTSLTVTANNIDIEVINNFHNLQLLTLKTNNTTNLNKLRLTKLYFLSCSQKTNINDLFGCPNLRHVSGVLDFSEPQTVGPALNSISLYNSETGIINLDNLDTSNLENIQILNDVKLETTKVIPTLESINFRYIYKNKGKVPFKLSLLNYFPNIKRLNLKGGMIDDVESDWCHMNLNFLFCTTSKIESLDFISKFPNLTEIILQGNKIESLEPLTKSNKLVYVNLSNNNIVDIPRELANNFIFSSKNRENTNKRIINLKGNPLISPPIEIIERGEDSAKPYFDSMVGDTEELNEAKIIFLGNGEVGKTSLMKVLSGDCFNSDEETTHGINIKKYTVPINEQYSVDASIWDFGGQQIMHATHQLFLSRRCVYVLVINDRRDDLQQEQKINYWLQQVQTYGGNSKVIIIRNKCDMFTLNNVPEGKLKEKYPNLVAIESVSCKTGHNINRVKNLINEQVRQLPMRKVQLAKNWIQIKDEIKALSREHDHLPLSSFTDICNRHEVTDYEAQKTLRNLLHDLSVIIAFEELDGFNMGILNPHWITDGIYTIINSEVLAKKKGYIKLPDVQKELDEKHPNKYNLKARFIIESMMQFELCHPVGNAANKTYLVPNLLPNEIKSKDLKSGRNTIRFVFKYENLLPPSIIPSLLVRMSSQIADDKRWRTGAIMTDTGSDVQALVEEDSVERELRIIVTGSQARDYFSIIRHNIRNLNEPNSKALGVKELVPLGYGLNEYVDYEELIGLEVMGQTTYTSGRLKQSFPVSQLLSGIESRQETENSVARQRGDIGDINLKVEVIGGDINIKTGDVTNTNQNTLSSEQSQVSTQTIDIKVELKSLKGTGEYVLEDLKSESEYEILDEVQRERFIRECSKVQKALAEIEQVQTKNDANNKPGAFLRVSDFLTNALQKTGPVGEAVESLGSHITKVRDLAKKYNKVAGFFGFPTIPDILLD
ncbi:hypothetical protein U2G60_001630 [Vibrio fluvialis]|nr:hypothetical protein [Vibrio fluvialis]